MRIVLLLLGTVVVLMTSCVPNRKIVYLQHGNEVKQKDIIKDSVLRTHSMEIHDYRIQPQDVLSVGFETITGEEFDFLSKVNPQVRSGGGAGNLALSGVLVDALGEIEYPVIGKVKVAGMTVFEAQRKMQEAAGQYLKGVVVRIRLLNFRFTILGEVNGEKSVVSTNTRVTMMEAIGLSGGLTELADRRSVKVVRQKGSESEIYYVDLLKEDFIESPYYYVQQNDIIIVPPLRQRVFRRYFSQNLALTVSTLSAVLFIITLTQ